MSLRFVGIFVLLLIPLACASPEAARNGGDTAEGSDGGEAGPALAQDDTDVQTVQLYRGHDETTLPILRINQSDQLTLEFDLMAETGRPLVIHFYHTDRNWKRDWSTSRFLSSFDQDQLIDFEGSLTTRLPYVHYTYRFPNRAIQFKESGNYVLRVSEIGNEDEVFFERMFFVTEQAGPTEFRFNSYMRPGNQLPALLPILEYSLPTHLEGSAFDLNTCFIRNARFTQRRCTDESLQSASGLQFELQPGSAFESRTTHYFLDLSRITTTGQINGIDRGVTPPAVWLDTDFAQFDESAYARPMHGQTVVSDAVTDVTDPDQQGEYVNVHFSYVPPKRAPYNAPIYISGSFNGWTEHPEYALDWNPTEQQYEGILLIKQGMYEYRYASPNKNVQRQLNQFALGEPALFTSMVYYSDPQLGTDRLLAVSQRAAR